MSVVLTPSLLASAAVVLVACGNAQDGGTNQDVDGGSGFPVASGGNGGACEPACDDIECGGDGCNGSVLRRLPVGTLVRRRPVQQRLRLRGVGMGRRRLRPGLTAHHLRLRQHALLGLSGRFGTVPLQSGVTQWTTVGARAVTR